MRWMFLILVAVMLLNSMEAASQAVLDAKTDSVKKPISLRILPQNFYTRSLAYTCQKEIQLQRIIRIPFYFRLGSKDQVDYLEGKSDRNSNLLMWRFADVQMADRREKRR